MQTRMHVLLGLIVFTLSAAAATPVTVGLANVSPRPGLQTEDIDQELLRRSSAAIDLAALNSITDTRLFRVVGEEDLASTLKTRQSGQRLNWSLSDPAFAEQVKSAGLKYVLITTIEDLREDVVELGSVALNTATVHKNAAVGATVDTKIQRGKKGRKIRKIREVQARAAKNAIATAATHAPRITERQELYVSVSYKLFDGQTGSLIDSASRTFTTNRTATRIDDDTELELSDDFIRTAAKDIGVWTATRVADAAFPISVVSRDKTTVRINRTTGPHTKPGQIYTVVGQKDGKETALGKVRLIETGPEFATAHIVEDYGIVAGAVAHRADK